MSSALTEYRAWLASFARRIPELLAAHPSTASLAGSLSALQVEQQLSSRFTLAIIGRMKSGKSTLLNALLGRQLAPVGVTETTATINWFDHSGQEGSSEKFQVEWQDADRETQELPLKELKAFLGRSQVAERVAYLRFFADSEFLRKGRMIDTPGMDSTIEDHEAAIVRFLTDPRDGRLSESRADAVVLVLPATAKERDVEAIETFTRQSRLPGQGPYNSIAVLQKWELLDGDPVAQASGLADKFKRRLDGRVADVIPVSGMLFQLATLVPLGVHDQLASWAAKVASKELRKLTEEGFRSDPALPDGFYAEIQRCLSGGEVNHPDDVDIWPVLHFALVHARNKGIARGEALARSLRETSRIDELRALLEKRFFALSSLIQAGAAIKTTLRLCRQAQIALQTSSDRRTHLTRLAEQVATDFRTSMRVNTVARGRLIDLIEESKALWAEELAPIETTRRDLGKLVDEASSTFESLMADVTQIITLEQPTVVLDDDFVRSLRRLFGINGLEICERLGLPDTTPFDELRAGADQLQRAIAIQPMLQTRPEMRALFSHAMDRIQLIHQALDEQEDRAEKAPVASLHPVK